MCIYTQHTHTHPWIQRKSRQKLVSSKHTCRRKWTAFTEIPMFITFLPREAAVTSVKTKPLIEAWPLTGSRNQSKDFGAMTAPTNGTGGSQERRQGHSSGCSLNHTCTGTAQTAQLGDRRDHRFQLQPPAGQHNLEFQVGQVICLLKQKMNSVLVCDLCSLQKCLWRSSIDVDTWDWCNM